LYNKIVKHHSPIIYLGNQEKYWLSAIRAVTIGINGIPEDRNLGDCNYCETIHDLCIANGFHVTYHDYLSHLATKYR
jgi:hypothetical protein